VLSLSGLTLAGDYTVAVTADNAVGSSLPMTTHLFQQSPSFFSGVTKVRYGSPLTLVGTLSTTQAEHGTVTVDVQFRTAPTQPWGTIGMRTVSSNSPALVSFPVVLPRTGYYRTLARARGAFLTAPSASSALVTVVPLAAPTVTVRPSAVSARRGTVLSFTVGVSSHVSGSTAVLQHLVRGRWVAVVSAPVSARNSALLRARMTTTGRSSWRVAIPAVTGRMNGTTGRAITVTVR
jgi:hypothetical protein